MDNQHADKNGPAHAAHHGAVVGVAPIPMKNRYKLLFMGIFLAIIYAVPVTQTIYDYATNSGHRVQMADLFEDIFTTPVRKARADGLAIDTLQTLVAALSAEIDKGKLAAGDTARPWNPQAASGLADDALIKVRLLRESVLNYNRHIQGDKNSFAKQDTLKPYYRALGRLEAGIEAVQTALQASDAAAASGPANAMTAQAAEVRKLFGSARGVERYAGLTLTAVRRILIGANYLRPYEKEMEKSSVFANNIRPWMLFGYYGLFEDLGDKGVLGKYGWFFYRPDVDYLVKPYVFDERSQIVDANDAPITESIVDSVRAFRDQLNARGIDLLVVIMPGKPSIYPELLSPAMKREAVGSFSHSVRMMHQLQAAGVETVDLFKAFADERRNDSLSGDSLYLHTDTHFRGRGVLAAARTVADRVKQYGWYQAGATEYAIDTLSVPRMGDVGEMTKLPALRLHALHFSFAPEQATCYKVCKVERDATGAVAGKTPYKDDYQHSRILVLGDSFSRIYQTDEPRSAGWISHLAFNLSQPVASIVNDGGASTLVRQMLARKPGMLKNKKLVVWEIVERDFRFGAEGWKNVQIAMDK